MYEGLYKVYDVMVYGSMSSGDACNYSFKQRNEPLIPSLLYRYEM